MGKSRRNRSGASKRSDPVGSRPRQVKEPADPALAALRNDKILPVVKDLRSSEVKTRTAAASAIANIVEDPRCRKLLLREQVVHVVLSETLADSSIESRAAGWEVLNVLAQHEESDFCVHLYRSDVLTPAAHALTQILETLASTETPFAKLTKAQQEYVWRITTSVLDVVGQLAEARPEILAAVTGNGVIVRAFFALVASPVAPMDIQWGATTGLARLCDDASQRDLAQAIVDDVQTSGGGFYTVLLKLKGGTGPLAVAACALLHAVFATLEWFDHSPGRDGASDAVLIPTLAKAVQDSLDSELAASDDSSLEAEALDLALQTLAMIGTTLKASLEKGNRDESALKGARGGSQHQSGGDNDDDIGELEDDTEMFDGGDADTDANGGAPLKNGDKDAEEDDDDDAMGMDMDMDMEGVTGADDRNGIADDAAAGLGELPTLRELIATAVPRIVLLVTSKRQAVDAAAVPILLDSLSVLNNMAWTLSLVDVEDPGNDGILQAWAPAARRIWLDVVQAILAQDEMDLRVVDTVASLAWALSRVLGGETPVEASAGGEVERFIRLRDSASGKQIDDSESGDPLQTLAVKCIGVLGQIARDPAPAALNRRIGQYFVRVAEALPQTPAAEAVEALDQLLDIYGDEDAACDKEVFWADKFLGHLEGLVFKVKAMAKSVDKRAQGELRSRADEVVLNLGRFIQYKKKHAP